MNKIFSILFSFAVLTITSCAYADKNTLWTSDLNKRSTFKNYVLINNSEEIISKEVTSAAGSRSGKDMLNSSFRVVSNNEGMVTVESILNSPDLKNNRISTKFSSKTFSIKVSNISIGGGKNRAELTMTKNKKGGNIRILTETETQITTKLLDNKAPLVDIISILYLMQGNNGSHAKKLNNKSLYFYLNGLLRKAKIQLAGSEKIIWFKKPRNTIRFNLIRGSDNIGSIWIEADNAGEPLKIKIGLLNFFVK